VSGQLGAQHGARVRSVGRDHEEAAVAASEQLVVEAVAVHQHVREQPAVLVTRFGVELEGDMPADELGLRELARDVPEALDRLARIDDLGSIQDS